MVLEFAELLLFVLKFVAAREPVAVPGTVVVQKTAVVQEAVVVQKTIVVQRIAVQEIAVQKIAVRKMSGLPEIRQGKEDIGPWAVTSAGAGPPVGWCHFEVFVLFVPECLSLLSLQ